MCQQQRSVILRPQFIGTALFLSLLFWVNRDYISIAPSASGGDTNCDDAFPRKIWQTWEQYPQDMNDEYQRLSKTWTDLNREYRYELLTSESATTYVQDHFKSEPRIVQNFERLGDAILRADMIRYLTLLAEGGVYSDMDTDCTRPVRDWVPFDLLSRTNVVFGIAKMRNSH